MTIQQEIDKIDEKLREYRERWRVTGNPGYKKYIETAASFLKDQKKKLEKKLEEQEKQGVLL